MRLYWRIIALGLVYEAAASSNFAELLDVLSLS